MKLILAIVRDSDSDNVTQVLTSASFRVTRVASMLSSIIVAVAVIWLVPDRRIERVFAAREES